MSNNERISLRDRLQRKWFEEAMQTLRENYPSLSDYQRRVFNDLESGYEMAGHHMTVTRKQMNFIKQLAMDIESGA